MCVGAVGEERHYEHAWENLGGRMPSGQNLKGKEIKRQFHVKMSVDFNSLSVRPACSKFLFH